MKFIKNRLLNSGLVVGSVNCGGMEIALFENTTEFLPRLMKLNEHFICNVFSC